ncbi:MAG: VWA domain-containing protein [Planctomycetes bacterium]|nr:VWA domain-containing protein [Planctomycetota bacterium]
MAKSGGVVETRQTEAATPHREVFTRVDVAHMMNQAPWWVVSLVIHGILLVILAAINFSGPPRPHKWVHIDSGLVVLTPPEIPVPTRPQMVGPDCGIPEDPGTKAEKAMNVVKNDVPVARPPVIGPKTLSRLFDKIGQPGFRPAGGGDLFKEIRPGRISDRHAVVDDLAKQILKAIERHDLLVVLLYDESKSLIEDRKLIARQIRKTVGDLQAEMKPRERQKLRWAVVSYGEKPTLWLQPTGDLKELVDATDKIGVDESGKENVIEAIHFTMQNLGVLGKHIFLVLVTDEEGDDTRDRTRVNAALQSMQAAKARLFVFGREASFQLAKVREWMRDPKTGERIGSWGWADRGIESCRQEFFPADWFWNAQYSFNGVPAGFGCWVQSMLAKQTGGTYYMLSDAPPKYDDEILAEYEPEWEPTDVYAKRTETSRLRKTMEKLFADYAVLRPTHWLTQLHRVKAQTKEENRKAQRLLKLVDRALDELEPLRSQSRKEKYAGKRWQANYDLTMAQLARLKFQIREYIHVTDQALRRGFPKPKKRQKFNLFAVTYDRQATEAASGRRGDREMERARDMLTRVARDYNGTPWAEIAKQELRRTMPLEMRPIFYIQGMHIPE